MLKKVITITIIVITALAILIGAYILLRKAFQVITGPEAGGPEITVKAPEKIRILSGGPVFDYWIFKETSGSLPDIYYFTPEGKILKASINGDEVISSQPIENLQSIKPSTSGLFVIVKFGNILSPQFSILNIKEKSWQPLPLNVRAVDLSPNTSQIATLLAVNGKDSLIIQDFGALKPTSKNIISLYQKNLDLKWLTPEKVLLTEKPSPKVPTSLWEVELASGNIKPLISENIGLWTSWSKNGDLGLKQTVKGNGDPSLEVINADGKIFGKLDLLTFLDKCTADSEFLYCGVPQNLAGTESSSLLDRYLKNATFFKDVVSKYKRNKVSGNFSFDSEIATGDTALDVLRPEREKNSLFFINRLDQKLYQLEL